MRRPGSLLPAFALSGILLTGALPLSGQAFGRVIDGTTDGPVANAGIALIDADGEVQIEGITDAEGLFALPVPYGMEVRIEVSALGYVTSATGLQEMTEADFFEIRLSPAPLSVDGLQVEVERRDRFLELNGFYHRARTGRGQSLGPDRIEEMLVLEPAEIFRRLPGMTARGREPIFTRSAFAGGFGRRCGLPSVFLDGVLVRSSGQRRQFDDVVPPATLISAVEAYYGPASVPAQFAVPESHCGVILVWTERGP